MEVKISDVLEGRVEQPAPRAAEAGALTVLLAWVAAYFATPAGIGLAVLGATVGVRFIGVVLLLVGAWSIIKFRWEG